MSSRPIRAVIPLIALSCSSPGEAPPKNLEPAAQDTSPPLVETGGDTSTPVVVPPGPAVGSNILFILSDDQGVDKVGVYAEHPDPPPTPVLDQLAAEGVLFRRAYAHPVCSPTRAAILTGRYNDRYGLGDVIHPTKTAFSLRDAEVILPEVLTQTGYHSEALGKWHLAGFSSEHGLLHPLVAGFTHYAGAFGNLADEKPGTAEGLGSSYYWWQKTTDGEQQHVHRFATSDTVDDAIDKVATMPEPWLLYVAFNAPHTPLTVPPAELYSDDLAFDAPDPQKVDALVESMDTEIGRLLESFDPEVRARTTVIFMGDNGTFGSGMSQPWRGSHGKNTPYEGGIRVPLIVQGPAVVEPGREVDELVHAVDLFPTMTDLAGVDLTAIEGTLGGPLVIDGISIMPYLQDPTTPALREYVYTGKFGPNGAPTEGGQHPYDWDIVLDKKWKYIRGYGNDELYDLENPGTDDGMEGANLLKSPLSAEAQEAYDRLTAELVAIEARAVYEIWP